MKYNLNDLIIIISGGTPKTTNSEYWNGEIPWLSIKDFSNCNRYVFSSEKHISYIGLINSSSLLMKSNIIISARGTVGKIAQIGKDNMAFNQSCYGIKSKNELILSNDYLFYWCKYNVKAFKQQSYGSVFDTITLDSFKNIKMNLPSLVVQHHIVDNITKEQF